MKSWRLVGKLALMCSGIAAALWIGGALLIPHDLQAAIAGAWNGVFLTIAIVCLALWASVSLWTQGRGEERNGTGH